MPMSDDLDALEAQREYLEEREKHVIKYRHSSPRREPSSQAYPSSPAPRVGAGNPFLMEDDEDDEADATMREAESNDRDCVPVGLPLQIATDNPTSSIRGTTSSGRLIHIARRKRTVGTTTFISDINDEHASKTRHFGIEVHKLLSDIEQNKLNERSVKSIETCDISTSSGLWVDKYRPSKFTELLGDERTNRDVLRWLKHWDSCVFGKASKVTSEDPYKRPEKRILMLTGPPGFGKTTLAHIAARQAGYNIIEINASDDRTGAVVQNKIQDALESQAVFQARPSCLVIDEIDGVSAAGGETGFIKRLLNLVLADEKASTATSVPGTTGVPSRKPKRRSNKPLLRPIIVICNDLYAPALRTLRPYCQVVYFKASVPASLVARLRTICHQEGLQADVRALNALCEVSEHDLRSCVNSLQLVRTRSRQFTLESVSQTLAQRDMARSPHAVVESIFKLPDAKRERKKGVVANAEKQRIVQIADLVQSTNEYGKIMEGLFAHFPKTPYHDSHFQKPLKAASWLAFYDFCERGVYEGQHGELMGYMPWAASAMHHLFATHESPRTLERSKQAWQAREKTAANEDLFRTWQAGCQPSIRQCQNAVVMKTELLSYGMRIVGSTRINPMNVQLIVKPAERKQLARVVDAMIVLGLDYKQYRNDDGSYIYRLEPALAELLNFEDATGASVLKGESLLPSRYAVRQIIAQEIASERIRRQQEALLEADNAADERGAGQSQAKREAARRAAEIAAMAAKKRALPQDEAVPAQEIKKDFFGRVVVVKPVSSSVGSLCSVRPQEQEKPKATVYIRFSDGFSDAVRNPISIKELLRGTI